jgi:nucleoside-diphosphate-sugar epimerase
VSGASKGPSTDLVAVTGATGFVGSHLLRRLAESGRRIRILTRRLPENLPPEAPIELVLGDLEDRSALRRLVTGADRIVHIAGIIKARHAADFQRVNVAGTRNVAEAVAEVAPQARVIHVSSLAARQPELSPYAASKREGETAIGPLAEMLPLTIIRPPAVYGPGDTEILPMFRVAETGFLPYPAAPRARVSLIHVDDLAGALLTALTAPRLPDLVYEVDDGQPGGWAWPEIAAALGSALARPVRPFRLPRNLMALIAAASEAHRHLGGPLTALCQDKLAELYHPDWVARGPRLQDCSAWRPALPLAAGLQATAAWYRRKGWLKVPA